MFGLVRKPPLGRAAQWAGKSVTRIDGCGPYLSLKDIAIARNRTWIPSRSLVARQADDVCEIPTRGESES